MLYQLRNITVVVILAVLVLIGASVSPVGTVLADSPLVEPVETDMLPSTSSGNDLPNVVVDKAVIMEAYGQVPLSFIPNKGQTDSQVQFTVRSLGGTLYFTPQELVLALPNPSSPEPSSPAEGDMLPSTSSGNALVEPAETEPAETAQLPPLRQIFDGSNPNPTLSGGELLPGKVNYFIGNDPDNWQTDLPTYAGLGYQNLYTGIDLLYEGQDGQLKSTYTVAPNINPDQIRWHYKGASDLWIDSETGDLVIEISPLQQETFNTDETGMWEQKTHLEGREDTLGEGKHTIREQAPIAWQDIAGQRVPVEVAFDLAADGSLGFTLGVYDPTYPLVIDPVTLAYSTYLGGSGDDMGYGIAVDGSGNVYITGETASTNFPTTAGAKDETYLGGTEDAFVTKLNTDGSALSYSTYLGGSGFDEGYDIAVDGSGNVYITGETASTNFPTTVGAHDETYLGGSSDAFVTKLNTTGSALSYSTYLGGNATDEGTTIVVDSSGNAYVTGYTTSTDFSTTVGAKDTIFNGLTDAFVTKLNVAGTGLIYSTYMGGSCLGFEQGRDIAIDSSGFAYVTGRTDCNDFPTTVGAYDTFLSGASDAFVTKLNAAGSDWVYSTYLGGLGIDTGDNIAVDSSGNAYVTGKTNGLFVTTGGAYDTTSNGTSDAFVTKLNTTGSGLTYSTYLGGAGDESGNGIAVDSSGNAYVTGYTTSSSGLATAGAYESALGGTQDAFVTKLNAAGNGLIYSTYLGGAGTETGWGIAVDSSGNAYVTGETASNDFPTTVGVSQGSSGGGTDVFVAKVIIVPEIGVTGNGATIISGDTTPSTVDHTDFGLIPASGGFLMARTFTVNNTNSNGVADLTVSNPTFSGGQPSHFSLTQNPAATISSGSSTTFQITLAPSISTLTTTVDLTTTVSISNNDSDENPYSFVISGTAFPPPVEFNAAAYSVNEGDGNATVTIDRPFVSVGISSVDVVFIDHPATTAMGSGTDYISTTKTANFNNGDSSATITVPIINDSIDEDNELLVMILDNPSNALIDPGMQVIAGLLIIDDDVAGLTHTMTAISVDETGPTSDSYTLTLTSQPTQTVQVDVTTDAQCNVTAGNPTNFGAGDWNSIKSVTVQAVDDALSEGSPHSCVVTHTMSSSVDTNYKALSPVTIAVDVTDNDTPGITINPTSLTVAENGGTSSFTVKLDTQPTVGNNVIIPLSSSNVSDCTVSTSTLTILNANWNVDHTVTVTGTNDNLDNAGNQRTCTITTGDPTSTDGTYDALVAGSVADVTVTVNDDDGPVAPPNTPPIVPSLPDRTMLENTSILVTVVFTDNAASSATVQCASSNDTLVPTNNHPHCAIAGQVDGAGFDLSSGSNNVRIIRITPAKDQFGQTNITLTINDGQYQTSTSFLLTVTEVNAPIAQVDAYNTAENTALIVTAPGVLANDSDVDGDSLLAILVKNPISGSLTLNQDGSFYYNPLPDESGTDSFVYQATDGVGNSTPVTVTITIGQLDPPIAQVDMYNTAENTALIVTAPGVLSNDHGDSLLAMVVKSPVSGSLTLNQDGSFYYDPLPGELRTDSFVYQATDVFGKSTPATVTIIIGQPDPPTTQVDTYNTAENTALIVTAPGVLSNDYSAYGDSLLAMVVKSPISGSLMLNQDGSFYYNPLPDESGTDSFVYQATDGIGNSTPATVTITIGQLAPPIAQVDAYNTAENTALIVTAPGVLSNDHGDNLLAILAKSPISGSLTLNQDGSFYYDPLP
ncbi:SBBP repeat-containing protein, partial [Anaerolineales bacterium HSG25]|nr:SBBP repeat-containing protein [Anaerolineales bacterium HSG25]